MKTRDAQGLAYHTLSVLISYRRCFDTQLQHVLVEVLLAGLNDQPSTIKCCLHSLSLAAFEMQNSMTKYMSRILEKLSQIISNPAMAVHILDFLVMVASLPGLYANFTESDFKMVFGVALRYLQHHNRPGSSLGISWTLSEHVRIMCFYLVYVWFLAIKLPDRPRHVPFITRQLLLANEGKEKVDEPTEVCFDWLARYAYGSADPRPAGSLLNDIVTESQGLLPAAEAAISEKTWIQGNSVVTIRVLPRRGWIEVICRRPSGFTKFLCRAENVPIVGPGDVDPDFITSTAALLLDHDALESGSEDQPTVVSGVTGSAPSQRRKEVAVDPSFFALQLSAYPDGPARSLFVADSTSLPPFFRTLDRMPVIDTHKVGIMYVSPGQTSEEEILRNTHGSPAYARFLEGLGRLIDLRGQMDVYAGGLDPDEDGEYAYAWWDDIGQILYHTATLMPTNPDDMYCINKKRHIGNDYVRIVWNDSGHDYQFDTLRTQFQFVNIVIEPHSHGAIAAYSNNLHEIEYFKVKVQRAPGMEEFTPIGDFKLVSADNLPFFVRQLSSLSDWFASVFDHERRNPGEPEMMTNWRSRLREIQRFRGTLASSPGSEEGEGLMRQEGFRDFTTSY
ncbi:hypothetical protein JAAARDRAFT_135282 [Jaapia argillacea MUCL 33604]|uniref:Rap-GAP domain-containing protein n=1 Tax=Jaapia argillacea MUCL 33604 TaxID=933084 RepID=A0A067PIA2_9AGAM|nr:hypothetical protein JAAARDRAFT_135282 [Jaapia argillacea MUCL 33604]